MSTKPTDLPRWSDVSPGTTTVEPASGTKDTGFLAGERPPAQTFNWLYYIIYLWIVWLNDGDVEFNTVETVDLTVTGEVTDDLVFAANKDVEVSGTGSYKHGSKTVWYAASSALYLNEGGGAVAGHSDWTLIGALSPGLYANSVNQFALIPLNALKLLDKIETIKFFFKGNSAGAKLFELRYWNTSVALNLISGDPGYTVSSTSNGSITSVTLNPPDTDISSASNAGFYQGHMYASMYSQAIGDIFYGVEVTYRRDV